MQHFSKTVLLGCCKDESKIAKPCGCLLGVGAHAPLDSRSWGSSVGVVPLITSTAHDAFVLRRGWRPDGL